MLASLSACSIANFFLDKGNRLDWTGLTVVATEGANMNTAVALDVVLLRDEATLAIVSGLSASKWFAGKADLMKTFPEGMSVQSMEIAPAQTLKIPARTFGSAKVVGVIIFADYLTPGEHRMRVDQLQGDIVVQLGARSYTVSALKLK